MSPLVEVLQALPGALGRGALTALLVALAVSALPLPWLHLAQWSLPTWLLLASAVCLACQGALGVLVQAGAGGRAADPRNGWWLTAGVSGLVSTLATALAGSVGPFWAGLLTSPPLLAAAVALELHRQPGQQAATLRFLHGYVAGLLGRGAFVAVFGALLPWTGAGAAFAAGLALSLVLGGLSSRGLAPAVALKS